MKSVQKMFEGAKEFVREHSRRGLKDTKINEILKKRPFVLGEFIIDEVLHIGTRPFDLGIKIENLEVENTSKIQLMTKEWNKYVEEKRKEGEVIITKNMYEWVIGTSSSLPKGLSLTSPKIDEFAKKYKLKPVFCTEKGEISHVCLINEKLDIDEATLYPYGYFVGTTLEPCEKRDAKMYESIGKEIYGLKEKVFPIKGAINSLRRRHRQYWERIDREMEI
jgi:hypothetical protein